MPEAILIFPREIRIPIYGIYRSASTNGNRVFRLPDVSGEIITTGNVDVLFGGGDGGRDLSSASISEMLTVKGNTFLGDDRADGISFGGSVQQASKEITGSSVLRWHNVRKRPWSASG